MHYSNIRCSQTIVNQPISICSVFNYMQHTYVTRTGCWNINRMLSLSSLIEIKFTMNQQIITVLRLKLTSATKLVGSIETPEASISSINVFIHFLFCTLTFNCKDRNQGWHKIQYNVFNYCGDSLNNFKLLIYFCWTCKGLTASNHDQTLSRKDQHKHKWAVFRDDRGKVQNKINTNIHGQSVFSDDQYKVLNKSNLESEIV